MQCKRSFIKKQYKKNIIKDSVIKKLLIPGSIHPSRTLIINTVNKGQLHQNSRDRSSCDAVTRGKITRAQLYLRYSVTICIPDLWTMLLKEKAKQSCKVFQGKLFITFTGALQYCITTNYEYQLKIHHLLLNK